MIQKLQAEKEKKEIEMRALIAYNEKQRQENFTKQIGSIKICKHLAGNKEAEAQALELDRRNREKSPNAPKPKCTCSIGRRALLQKAGHLNVDNKVDMKMNSSSESSSEISSVTSDSRDSSVEKIVVSEEVSTPSVKVEVKDDDFPVKAEDKQKSDVSEPSIENNVIEEISGVNSIEEKEAESSNIKEIVNDGGKKDKFPIQEMAGRDVVVTKEEDKKEEDIIEHVESGKINTDTENDKTISAKLNEDKYPIQEQAGQETESKTRKEIKADDETETHENKANDFVKCSLLSEKDITPCKNVVSGFKVIKIEDQENNLYEVNVSAACVKVSHIKFLIYHFV